MARSGEQALFLQKKIKNKKRYEKQAAGNRFISHAASLGTAVSYLHY